LTSDDDFLLALLNSTPVIDGAQTDGLADADAARAWLVDVGGLGTEAELLHLLQARTALQGIVRGQLSTSTLPPLLRGVTFVPVVHEEITWALRVEPTRGLAVRAILAWDTIVKQNPGRLRPCANDECRLFLIDRSAANRARWCSMAVCGNRMKARRHYQRARDAESENRQ
jgi:predicted RNA-binding Zn ribbon-like protein